MRWLQRLQIDSFLLAILVVVFLASLFPCRGLWQTFFDYLTVVAISLLFFMHGAKLSREAMLVGIRHWRLHLVVFTSTFILFPLLGLVMKPLALLIMTPTIYLGFLYLCALPATVQSAIVFTSVAGGNIAAAICSASASSILGVFLSPLLVELLMNTQEGELHLLQSIGEIVLQLMVPFIIGHLMRPIIGQWVDNHRNIVNISDRSSILLVVYTAFSAAVIEGIWQQVDILSLLGIVLFVLLLLSIVIVINTLLARWLNFNKQDEITIVFCGSKKSLTNGIPMAHVLFPAASVGIIVLPLMIFHQIQLMVCAVLARRYARKAR